MDIKISDVQVEINQHQKKLFSIKSYQIAKGKKLLIKGASGQGKTTFLHLIAGLFLPLHGDVYVGATNIVKLSEKERALFRRQYMGIIFEKLNLIEHLSVSENIELSFFTKNNKEKIKSALKNVGLEGRELDRVSALSLGEQQRVAVARVLAMESEVVLADEPTSSLDEKNALDVIKLLGEVSKNKSLIVVSHDPRIESYFDEVIDFGELIANETI